MTDTPVKSWRTWLQLLRAPNLFTVPGDALAGFLLTTGGNFDFHFGLIAIGASLCFYSHGLLLNDLADLAEDRRDRPSRPLPSGAVDFPTVLVATVALAVVALLLCLAIGGHTIGIGFALLVAIVVYNLWSKKIPVLGPVNMGLCRGLSILLGASAGLRVLALFLEFLRFNAMVQFPGGRPNFDLNLSGHPLALAAAAGITVYIAAVTHLARIETQANPPKLPRTLPFVALVTVVASFFFFALDRTQLLRSSNVGLYLVSAYTLYAGYRIHQRLTHEPPPPIPPMIGQLIRLLLPLQAIFCLASRSLTGAIAAIALLVLWPISKTVSRRFYAS